jgi:hypothetical protein
VRRSFRFVAKSEIEAKNFRFEVKKQHYSVSFEAKPKISHPDRNDKIRKTETKRYEAKKCRHAERNYIMDMDMDHRHGHADRTQTLRMDTNMDMQHGHSHAESTWTYSTEMDQHH